MAPSGDCASHSVNYANHQHLPFARRRHDFRQAAAQRCKLHFSRYRLVKVSWKSVQPFTRTVVSYFLTDGKKTKTYTLPPHRRLRKLGNVTHSSDCKLSHGRERTWVNAQVGWKNERHFRKICFMPPDRSNGLRSFSLETYWATSSSILAWNLRKFLF